MRSASLILLVLLVCGCNRGHNGDQDSENGSSAPAAKGPTVRKPLYPEADVIGILSALGDAEIAAARVAREVTQNDEVLQYAAVMISDYRGIAQLVDSVARQTGVSARENAISMRIRTDGDSIARGLAALPVAFNNTYIEESIKAHEQALLLMDTAIVPSAQNPELKSLLTAVRPAIAAHLQRAKQLHALRRKQAAERGEPWLSGLHLKLERPAEVSPAPAVTPTAPAPQPLPVPVPVDTLPPPTTTSNM